jgi:hypothetical protein
MFVVQTRVAFAEAKKMHRIKHVGFASAVEAGEAVEARQKVEGLAFVIFKMDEFERGEMHGGKCSPCSLFQNFTFFMFGFDFRRCCHTFVGYFHLQQFFSPKNGFR